MNCFPTLDWLRFDWVHCIQCIFHWGTIWDRQLYLNALNHYHLDVFIQEQEYKFLYLIDWPPFVRTRWPNFVESPSNCFYSFLVCESSICVFEHFLQYFVVSLCSILFILFVVVTKKSFCCVIFDLIQCECMRSHTQTHTCISENGKKRSHTLLLLPLLPMYRTVRTQTNSSPKNHSLFQIVHEWM